MGCRKSGRVRTGSSDTAAVRPGETESDFVTLPPKALADKLLVKALRVLSVVEPFSGSSPVSTNKFRSLERWMMEDR